MATNSSGSRGFLSGRLGPIIVAVVVTGVVVSVACFAVWLNLGGGAWRGEVSVMEAELRYPDRPDRLTLGVASCNGAPRVSLLRETDVDVQVKVIAFSTPFHGGDDCDDHVEVYLREPLGDRVVIDRHTGQIVSVRTGR